MQNITVKKADGTTTVVFVAKRPSGANTPALYMADAESPVAAFRSTLTIADRRSANSKGAQRVEINFTRPVTQVINGVVTQVGSVPIALQATVPSTLADAEISEAVSQCVNLLASADVLAILKSGYAPRS